MDENTTSLVEAITKSGLSGADVNTNKQKAPTPTKARESHETGGSQSVYRSPSRLSKDGQEDAHFYYTWKTGEGELNAPV